jgi:transcriptional regulator with XRE-family HTH domain
MSSGYPWRSRRVASSKVGEIASFCDDLRKARESQRVTLETISEKTRISLATLEALESGRWHEIEGAFLAGYIRLYARAAGLSPEKTLALFRQLSRRRSRAAGASFDDTGELLPRPEVVGATRMKVTLGWLVASRRVTFILFLFLLTSLMAVLISTKRFTVHVIPEAPFQTTLSYAQRVSHGPIEFIPPESSQETPGIPSLSQRAAIVSRREATLDLIAVGQCFVVFQRGDGIEYRRYLQPFDTLRIPVASRLFVAARPAGNAALFEGSREIRAIDSDDEVDTFEVVMRP